MYGLVDGLTELDEQIRVDLVADLRVGGQRRSAAYSASDTRRVVEEGGSEKKTHEMQRPVLLDADQLLHPVLQLDHLEEELECAKKKKTEVSLSAKWHKRAGKKCRKDPPQANTSNLCWPQHPFSSSPPKPS